ncbi:MAG: hypothetical protein HY403_03995 [Elusimicrobia bacterium]|nr:hypothetical protein [Elusimicrobiota bacterium]
MNRLRWAILAAVLAAGPSVHAQQTIFNVPSADVLDSRSVYVESDWYAKPWDSGAGRAAVTTIRGVVGLGRGLEGGVNIGSFDLLNESTPFADAALKWKPAAVQSDMGGLYVGTHAGVGLSGAVRGVGRSLTYGAAYAKLGRLGTRIGAGPYYATRQVFGAERGGALATVEQPTGVSGLTAAADWFSGRGGYATPGVIFNRAPLTWYLGYGFANSGREADVLTVELGITFASP